MKNTGLNLSPEMFNYILSSNTFSSVPYFENKLVKIGYGHIVPKTWLLKEKYITEEEGYNIFLKDLKKIERNPLITKLLETDKILYDICVHFIYDHGLQPFKNCCLYYDCLNKDYEKVKNTLEQSLEYFKNTPYYEKRLFDLQIITTKTYDKVKNNGYKKRIFKKNVSFSG